MFGAGEKKQPVVHGEVLYQDQYWVKIGTPIPGLLRNVRSAYVVVNEGKVVSRVFVSINRQLT